jgi:hypothetical protein
VIEKSDWSVDLHTPLPIQIQINHDFGLLRFASYFGFAGHGFILKLFWGFGKSVRRGGFIQTQKQPSQVKAVF